MNVTKIGNKILNSRILNGISSKQAGEAAATIALISTTTKDLVNCIYYTNQSLNIIAKDDGQSVFSGNYTETNGVKTPNAIYVENNINAGSINTEVISFENGKLVLQEKSSNFDSFDPSNNPALTLNATTNGIIRFDDQISGDIGAVNATYQMNIIGMAQNFEGKDEIYGLLGLSDDATVSEFVNAYVDYYIEQQYNINGIFVAAVGIHESAWGTSNISKNKKNLFGYGAYDSDPSGSAYTFQSYAEGIDLVARVFVKYYLNPAGTPIYGGETATGTYFEGATLTAVNTRYASDKNWANAVYKWMTYLYNKL